jgi:SPP1 family predicted phage head-tail adaptor
MAFNEVGIRAGKMRQRVTIVAPGTTRDTFGGTTPGGGNVIGNVWAEVTALSGRDAVAAQSFSSIATHKVTIRWMANVTAKCQVKFVGRNRTFQIEAPLDPDERQKVLHLLCVEVNDSVQQ